MTTKTSLPIIDISPFLSATSTAQDRQTCAFALSHACQNIGFFYLIGHSIPPSTTSSILSLSRQFFLESSDSAKSAISRRSAGHGHGDGARGYQKLGENITQGKGDWHEALDFYREEENNTKEGPPYKLLNGRNLYPQEPKGFETATKSYIEDMKRVGTAVVKAMGVALDLGSEDETDVFVNATRDSFWVMRMIGYPPLPKPDGEMNEDAQSCGTHTDYGCVTLLLADATKGALQVRAKDGSWIDADPLPGAFVVNIGDMIERWTNGLWRSTPHRVVHRGDGYRVSVPFFFEPDWEAVVEPLEKCVMRTGGERKFGRVKYGDHLTKKVEGNFY
ncbi:MAG: hypothetical protein M1820_007979 [Bogoriella megaspora]|nr:MAG: hypothetical protein M1820_007979 [Bogoriella megaspora]